MGQIAEGTGREDDALLGKQLDPSFRRSCAVKDGRQGGHGTFLLPAWVSDWLSTVRLSFRTSSLRFDHVCLDKFLDRILWKQEQTVEFDMAQPTRRHEPSDAPFRPARVLRDLPDGHHLHKRKSSVFCVIIVNDDSISGYEHNMRFAIFCKMVNQP